MSVKFLPPLQADTNYRVADFQRFELGLQRLRQAVTGEATGILHLHLRNRTRLDLPVSDEALVGLLTVLQAAFPVEALANLRERWPDKFGPQKH